MLQFADRPVNPASSSSAVNPTSSSSASPTDAKAGGGAASAGKMTRSERNDSARRRRQNWRWKCHMWRRSMTAEEFWTCAVTCGNWKTSATRTQRCSALANCDPESCSRDAPSGLNWNQHGIYAEQGDARAGIRVRIRRQHRRRSNDEEHPEQHRV